MANSIVFQSNPNYLKTGVYGVVGTSDTFTALKLSDNGAMSVTGTVVVDTIEAITTVATVSKVTTVEGVTLVTNVATVSKVKTVGTVTNVATVSKVKTVGTVTNVATVSKVTNVATVAKVNTVTTVATVSKVTDVATVAKVNTVTTVATVSKVTNVATVAKVSTVTAVTTVATVSKVTTVATVTKVTTVATVSKVTTVATVSKIDSVVDVNVASRNFVSSMYEVTLPATVGATITTKAIDVSKFSDTSFYIINKTATNVAGTLVVQMMAGPEATTGTYPFVKINEIATLTNNDPVLITTDYYLQYNKVLLTNSNANAQTVQVIFTGRY